MLFVKFKTKLLYIDLYLEESVRMFDYELFLVNREEYERRARGPYRGYIYTPEMPSFAVVVGAGTEQIRRLLAWAGNTIVSYQGQRAPIGRRLAAKRN